MIKALKDSDKVLLVLTVLLSIYGLFNIVTASSREAATNLDQSIYYYFYRHLVILVASFVAYFIFIKKRLKSYYKYLPILWVVFVGLNLYLVIQGSATRGATNWIDLGFFNLQPSELCKPLIIIYSAFFLEKYYKNITNPKINRLSYIIRFLLISIPIILLVCLEKDLGTAFILASIFTVLFIASPFLISDKVKTILISVGVLIVALAGLFLFKGNLLTKAQQSRFDFFDPCSHYTTTGYQVCNAFIAINKGNLTGVGIGKSSQKYSYIPEPHTDMVFSIISEENGFLGGTIIFILYILLIYRILRIASICESTKGRYIAIGVATYIFMHILINLGGLFGLIPLTGVPLPFLSYGGSFTLSLLISLAIVQRVFIENKRKMRSKTLVR